MDEADHSAAAKLTPSSTNECYLAFGREVSVRVRCEGEESLDASARSEELSLAAPPAARHLRLLV
jgi:hypothetical protein